MRSDRIHSGGVPERDRIVQARADLQRAADELRAHVSDGTEGGPTTALVEVAGAGSHDAGLGADTIEREVDLGLLDDFEDQLREVDEALARYDAGTYGTCIDCGGTIAPARLAALPAAPRCLPCQEHLESAHRHLRRDLEDEDLLVGTLHGLGPDDEEDLVEGADAPPELRAVHVVQVMPTTSHHPRPPARRRAG